MRTLSSVGLVVCLLTLAACEDVTGNAEIWRSRIGVLDASGSASEPLPRDAGNTSNPPAVTCYTADPSVPASERVWFAVSSVELPDRVDPPTGEVLSNCIVEADPFTSNGLMATIEGETPGWLYQFVVVY
jgi:hypothetical protein